MSFRLQPAVADDVAAITELAVRRTVHVEPFLISTMFAPTNVLERGTVARDGVELVGFAGLTSRVGAPVHQRTVRVFVARAAEGRGLGGQLLADVLAVRAPTTTELWSRSYDDDPRSLAVARHWGFEPVQLSIASTLALTGAAAQAPEPPDGVRLDLRHDLDLTDAEAEALDHLLAVCQTNPEAASHHALTREEIAHWADPGELALFSIAWVGVAAVAFCCTVVEESSGEGAVAYTGVDPAYRGRGLGRLVKQHGQHAAAQRGARLLTTDNAEQNSQIRGLNAAMGWQRSHGTYRLRRRV